MELWRDAFFIYYIHRGFPEHLRDERKEKLGLNLKLGDGEMFPLENISSGRGLEARERERERDHRPLKNILGSALPFSPQLENIPHLPQAG